MPDYDNQRPRRTPPHVSLGGLRRASGLTLDQVAVAVSDVLGPGSAVSRGTVSAIELGIRGASETMLQALEVAYGLEPGDLTTNYQPRRREQVSA